MFLHKKNQILILAKEASMAAKAVLYFQDIADKRKFKSTTVQQISDADDTNAFQQK